MLVIAWGVSIAATGLLGILLERFAFVRFERGSDTVTALITTIGLSYIIENCLTIASARHNAFFST